MKDHDLQLPASCAMLDEKEMTCTQGGGVIAEAFYAFGRMFRNTRYDAGNYDSKDLQVMICRYPLSQKDSGYTADHGSSLSRSIGNFFYGISCGIGDFFYGIGDLFYAFDL